MSIIAKKTSAGCCGNTNGTVILNLDKPVKKQHTEAFKAEGYIVPSNYVNSGFFYVRRDGLVASCTFGSTKVTVRCANPQKEEKIQAFQDTLERTLREN